MTAAVKDAPSVEMARVETPRPVEHVSAAPPTAVSANPVAEFLQTALQTGRSPEELGKLVELYERMEARQARKDFFAALTAFQNECPPIKKGSTASITSQRTGGKYSFTYADLEEIAKIVNPILARHGLSYAWNTTATEKMLTADFVLRHVGGHSETSSFTLPIENASGMSPQQKVGAAAMYAKRQSMSAGLGVITTDDETANPEDLDPALVTDDQVTVLDDLLKEHKKDKARFLAFMGVERLADIRAVDYERAEKAITAKPKAKAAAEGAQ